jgi:hypothetical protein
VGKAGVCRWAKNSHPRRDAKNASADRIGRASRPNLFHRMGGLRKENDDPNVFGCGRSVPGIDFVAASGFNDVSSTGILTYS